MTESPVSADASLAAPAQKLRSGIFLAPFHPLNEDPTLALRRDLELIEHLDRLGFDEAWIGEHHSAGFEIIASPELMIAAAAERTQRIRLGTGVVSLPYHHPLMVANRIVQLDHMTRGRVMLGVGPGLLPSDADMLGIDIGKQRERMAESLGVILRLLAGEVVSHESEWFTLRNASCHLRPYTWPRPEVAVASTITPSGAKLAGKYGLGMLCVAATQAPAYDALGVNFQVACDTAQAAGRSFSRDGLRLVAPMHLAATRAQAREDVSHGLAQWAEYFASINPNIPAVEASAGKDLVDRMIESGRAVIGTPDDAVAQVERLQKQSGGFGCLLLLAHNWAQFDRTKHSYELFARHVLPAIHRTNASRARSLEHFTERREELTGRAVQAVVETFAKHNNEREQR